MGWIVSWFTFLIIVMLFWLSHSTCEYNYSDRFCSPVLSLLPFAANFKCPITYSAQCLQSMDFRCPVWSKKRLLWKLRTSVRLTVTKYQQLHTRILDLVLRASQYNRVKKNDLMHNLFLVYFVNFYMFRAYLAASSGGTTVCRHHLVCIILIRWLSVVLVGFQAEQQTVILKE